MDDSTRVPNDAQETFLTEIKKNRLAPLWEIYQKLVIEEPNKVPPPVIWRWSEMVPVIDLAVRLGRAPIQVQRRTCIIVVEIHAQDQDHVLGLLADGVSEVVEIPHQEIEKAPSFGSNIRAEFIHGIAKRDNQFVVLLDAANALSVNELAHLVETELQ